MFLTIARIILRNKISLLIAIGMITAFFLYKATQIQLSYEFAKILPASDVNYKDYQEFKNTFGEDGSVMVIGVTDKDFLR